MGDDDFLYAELPSKLEDIVFAGCFLTVFFGLVFGLMALADWLLP